MIKVTADYILLPSGKLEQNQVLIYQNDGKILGIEPIENHHQSELKYYKGVICPGFVNTHCHLELSHMKSKVDTGTGFIPFITNVVKYREQKDELIQEAIRQADEYMWNHGIVAVGDISNTTDTVTQKRSSPIKYYTFVEMFDFLQEDNAAACFEQYKAVYEGHNDTNGNKKAMVPHAPYSVSKSLFRLLKDHQQAQDTISIHNQETVPENKLFATGKGPFRDFYSSFGIPMESWESEYDKSILYACNNMNPHLKTLFVHNTITDEDDIKNAHAWSPNVYWATCPNANLYIENRLPNYQIFVDNNAKMTIGTDSLTSNWQLSILEEMKTILKYQSYLSLEDVLTWATINGAEALGYQDVLGSFATGKYPGINWLKMNDDQDFDMAKCQVQKII